MATHQLGLSIPTGAIVNTDVVITVHGDGKKIGELRVSRGSIDWRPARHGYHIELGWEAFDDVMRSTDAWVKK